MKKSKVKKYIVIHEYMNSNGNLISNRVGRLYTKKESALNFIKRQKYPDEYFTQEVLK